MNSFNHYAYGSCGQWMFSTMAGIDTEGPGYQRLVIHPRPGGGITYVKAAYDSIHGQVVVFWRQQAGQVQLDVTIPVNTTAAIYIPVQDASTVTEGGIPAKRSRGVKFLRMDNGSAVYEIGSGSYRFTSKVPQS